MQTFLPYRNFVKSARVLDNKRLGKQRVEAYQILKALKDSSYGWQNHPAVKMWRGFEGALYIYLNVICDEWVRRGYKDNIIFGEFRASSLRMKLYVGYEFPKWLGDKKFHISHQSNLLRKDEKHYKEYFKKVKSNLPYYWPTT